MFVSNGNSLPTHLRPALLKSHFSPKAYSGVIFSFVESEDKDGDLSLGPIHPVQKFLRTCHLSLVPWSQHHVQKFLHQFLLSRRRNF